MFKKTEATLSLIIDRMRDIRNCETPGKERHDLM